MQIHAIVMASTCTRTLAVRTQMTNQMSIDPQNAGDEARELIAALGGIRVFVHLCSSNQPEVRFDSRSHPMHAHLQFNSHERTVAT